MKYISQMILILTLVIPIKSYCEDIYEKPVNDGDQAATDSYINSNKRVIKKYDSTTPQRTIAAPTTTQPKATAQPSFNKPFTEEVVSQPKVTEETQTIIDRILRSKIPSELNSPNTPVDEYNAKVATMAANIILKQDPYKIRLGTTGMDTRDYLRLGLNIKNELSTTQYKVDVVPNTGSVKNLIALQEGKLDWAIVNADALIALPSIDVEIIAKLPPKYAHLVIRRSGNDGIKDLDDLDGNDQIAVGDIGDDSHTTWTLLKSNVSGYSKIPTMTRGGYRAISASQVGLTQGFFRVCELLDPIMLNANDTNAFKLIHINNKRVYTFNNRFTSQMLYENVRMNKDVYNQLMPDTFFPKADTMEIPVLLVASKAWYSKYWHAIEYIYPNIQQAIRNVNDPNLSE